MAGDALTRHIEWMTQRGLSPHTISLRHRTLTRLAAVLGIPLEAATPELLAGWRAGLHHLAPATISAYTGDVRSFYAWATTAGIIAASPAAAIPSPRVPRRLPRPVSEEELLHALACAPPRIRLWLVLAAWCGLRAQEIACLRGEDIALNAIPPTLTVSWQGAKGNRERVVPLCSFAVTEIAAAGVPLRGWVFTRRDGHPGPNRPWVISHLASAHLHSCGSPATLHQLRHRFGTQAYHASKDLRAVQELMGHASPDTTAGYTAYDRAAAVAAVEALPVPPQLRLVTGEGTAG